MEEKAKKPRVSRKKVNPETEVIVEATAPVVEQETFTPTEQPELFVENEVITEQPVIAQEETTLVDRIKVAGTRFVQRIFKSK